MNVVQTRSLTKSYGAKRAVDNLDMRVAAGEIYGFVGKNGAGKSTAMKMMAGLARPTSGEIELFGVILKGSQTSYRPRATRNRTFPASAHLSKTRASCPRSRRSRTLCARRSPSALCVPRRIAASCWSSSALPTRGTCASKSSP